MKTTPRLPLALICEDVYMHGIYELTVFYAACPPVKLQICTVLTMLWACTRLFLILRINQTISRIPFQLKETEYHQSQPTPNRKGCLPLLSSASSISVLQVRMLAAWHIFFYSCSENSIRARCMQIGEGKPSCVRTPLL